MIDRALGIEAPARRKRPDNTSETSSNQGTSNLTSGTPIRSTKKLYQEESAKPEEQEEAPKQATSKSKAKKPANDSEEEIASPQVRLMKTAKVPITLDEMRSSQNHLLRESARKMDMRSSMRLDQKQPKNDMQYKLKWLAFLVISLVLMYFSMMPNRKAPGRK